MVEDFTEEKYEWAYVTSSTKWECNVEKKKKKLAIEKIEKAYERIEVSVGWKRSAL